MKKYLAAVVLAAALPQSAVAVTFPSLTTIYVGAGVSDDGSSSNVGIATSFSCSNVSGVAASIRFLILSSVGAVNSQSIFAINHGANITVSTHFTTTFAEDGSLATGQVQPQGTVNIESTQSGVFCTAAVLDAADVGDGIPLHLIRVNPHPGTVE